MLIRATSVMLLLLGGTLGLAAAATVDRAPARPQATPSQAAAPPNDPYPVATEARLGGDETQTRFVLDVSRTFDLRAFTLADPYRVVVDVPQVTFQLPPKTGESGRGLVKAFRFGLVMPGGSRIVLDLTRPARIERAFMLEPRDGQPARLVLDLAAVDRETFMRALAVENSRAPRAEAKPHEHETAQRPDPRPLIVIDPGHGGIDNGTQASSGEAEKGIVLDFALQLRDRLEHNGKYRTLMTRGEDNFVPLSERVRLARAHQAALFISIHADALPSRKGEAQGATVYTLSDTASDSEAARLADAENKADVIAGVDLTSEPDDVADILIDLAQRETKSFSTQFAHALVGELKASTRLHKRPLKSAGFKVLKSPDVPSVLVELGFVSNRQDLKQMLSETWRARATESVVRAVDRFFAKRLAGTNAEPN